MKKIAILQSNYIPWKGYFDLIAAADEVILYDDMQYTRRDWRNRNTIKTPHGIQWLTVPVKTKGKYYQTIRETTLNDMEWPKIHWINIERNYQRTPYFDEISTWLKPLYLNDTYTHLSPLNRKFIEAICTYLGITTHISNSWEYVLINDRSERLAHLVLQAKGNAYISGPAARSYIEESVFSEQAIKIHWFDYNNYPIYPQLWGNFEHKVSIIDLLFNCGKDAPLYMKYITP